MATDESAGKSAFYRSAARRLVGCKHRTYNSPPMNRPLALAFSLLFALSAAAAVTVAGTGSMLVARTLHTATLLKNGKVLIAGGYGVKGALASAELYDPQSGTFTATGSLDDARWLHTATMLPDGRVLITG